MKEQKKGGVYEKGESLGVRLRGYERVRSVEDEL